MNILNFRNSCAEDGIELTPGQATDIVKSYNNLKEEIESALEQYPEFYEMMSDRTDEEKIQDIRLIRERGVEMTLEEYNDLQELVKKVFEVEGY